MERFWVVYWLNIDTGEITLHERAFRKEGDADAFITVQPFPSSVAVEEHKRLAPAQKAVTTTSFTDSASKRSARYGV